MEGWQLQKLLDYLTNIRYEISLINLANVWKDAGVFFIDKR